MSTIYAVIDVTNLIISGGLLVLFLIIFAESGMMVGFFFPGDTLLFSAGILAAGGRLPLYETMAVIALAAILGDNVGYQIGKSMGPKLFKEDNLVFRHDHIMKAEGFFKKYGSKTMLVSHFIPIVRSFAPVTAGAAKMNRRQFFIYDAIGILAWTIIITLLGYFVGSRIPQIEHYIEPVLLLIIVIFLAPTIYHILKDPKIQSAIKSKLRPKKSKTTRETDD